MSMRLYLILLVVLKLHVGQETATLATGTTKTACVADPRHQAPQLRQLAWRAKQPQTQQTNVLHPLAPSGSAFLIQGGSVRSHQSRGYHDKAIQMLRPVPAAEHDRAVQLNARARVCKIGTA